MPIENVVFYGTNSIHLAKYGLSGGQLELKKGPWKDDVCKGKTSTERDRNRNGPGGQKGLPSAAQVLVHRAFFEAKSPKLNHVLYRRFGNILALVAFQWGKDQAF